MKWWLCISTATDDLKVYTYVKTTYGNAGYPRTDENGWYHAFSERGEPILVQKRFVAFMYVEKEAGE